MPVFSLGLPCRNKYLSFGLIVNLELIVLELAGVGGVLTSGDALAAGGLLLDLRGSF